MTRCQNSEGPSHKIDMVLTVISFPVGNRNILAHGRLWFSCVLKTIEFTSDDFALQGCFAIGVFFYRPFGPTNGAYLEVQ